MSQTDNTKTSQQIPQNWNWRTTVGGFDPLAQCNGIIPFWMTKNAVVAFFIALIACWIAFGYVPNYDLVITACLSVVLFFYASNSMSKKWYYVNEKRFLKYTFSAGLVIRLIWVAYMFFVFNPRYYGNTYGSTADTDWYMAFGRALAGWITGNNDYTFSQLKYMYTPAVDDIGYPMLLGVEYLLTGGVSDVFIPMALKCVMSAYCAILIYRIALRHFGVGTARIAAIFVCLNPNIIYWCASMMKEAEMVFVCCLAVDLLDRALSSNQLNFRSLWPGLLAGLALFFMRTPLGLAFFMAVLVHIVLASRRIISWGKKLVVGLVVVAALFVGVGDRLVTQSRDYLAMVQSDAQAKNMEWRSQRAGDASQTFAKYAGAAVFAPLIFTIPFPTFNTAEVTQLVQVQLAGGSYIKNIFSLFVVTILFIMLINGTWRRHVFIIAYLCAYLCVLIFSGFAQSGRFHMPIWPMLMLFAAYGLQLTKVNIQMRRIFTYTLCVEILACLAWNWFKLAGRGMI